MANNGKNSLTAHRPPELDSATIKKVIAQQLNDIQGRLGKLDQAAQTQAAAADKIDQRLADLHNKIHSINIKLAAAAAIFAVAVTAGGWLFKEAWDVVNPIVVQKLTATNGR